MLTGAPFHLDMLGRLVVQHGSREIRRFRTQKTAALLAYLALYKQRSHPRDVLIELLWPDSELTAARTNLSVALNALRRQLEEPGLSPGGLLLADRLQVRLRPQALTTDVEEFESLLRQAEGESEASQRVALQIRALNLYQGDLLPGYYESWLLSERDRLRDSYLFTLRQVVKGYAETSQYERALEFAHRSVQADPTREGGYHVLMRLYLAIGRPGDAIQQYRALEQVLHNELQTIPSAPLREMAEKARQAALAKGQAGRSRGIETRAAPTSRESSQVVSAPARTDGSSTGGSSTEGASSELRPPNIPLQFTRYFGHEDDIDRLLELLRPHRTEPGAAEREGAEGLPAQAMARLVTLTGPGGAGKTRLSVEVAWRLRDDFARRLHFIPLADLDDPRRLGETIRDSLGLPRQAQPAALEQVIAYLSAVQSPYLLVLDNFEQLAAGGAPVVWTLLNRVPHLHCLISSRRPLSLPGESEVPVLPLPTPPVEDAQSPAVPHLMEFPSVALFVDRAQAQRPEFQITPANAPAIAALCRGLEGLPLAIELAASRSRALTPPQILDRLKERFELLSSRQKGTPDRHRSLWAAIDWSFQLLPPPLRRLFAQLSIFRGGWSLEAAEVVCQETMALDSLAQMRACSLILAEESAHAIRFRMLETLREFASEQLTADERRETERSHAAYFYQWVTGAQLSGGERMAWLQRFEEDLDNVRAVLAWSLQEGNDLEIGLQIAGTLATFWRVRGHLSEGCDWYTRLLQHAGDALTPGLARSLYGAGALNSLLGDLETAQPLLERCREVALALGDDDCLALTHAELGNIAYRQGHYESARCHYEEHLALARALNMPGRIASALTSLASVAQVTGDYASSRDLYAEGLVVWRSVGDRVGEARTLHNLAVLAISERQLAEARRCFEESLRIKRELSDHYGISTSLVGFGEIATRQADYLAAFAYAREGLRLANAQALRSIQIDFLHLLVLLAWKAGPPLLTTRLSGAMESARAQLNCPILPGDREEYEQIQSALQKELGRTLYEAAREQGASLSLHAALVCAEEELARQFSEPPGFSEPPDFSAHPAGDSPAG